MGWYIYPPEPGTESGPCLEDCQHTDCAQQRKDAASTCVYCWKLIGYGTAVYFIGPHQLAHRNCEWAREEIFKASLHLPIPSDTTDWCAYSPWLQLFGLDGKAIRDSGYNGRYGGMGIADGKPQYTADPPVNPSGRTVLTWIKAAHNRYQCYQLPTLYIVQKYSHWRIVWNGRTMASRQSLYNAKQSAQALYDGSFIS